MTNIVTAVAQRIDRDGPVTFEGVNALAQARAILEYGMRSAGYAISFDPTSSADLVDYLTVTAASGIESATIGAGLGGLVGLLFGRANTGAMVGVCIGLATGAARGVERVERGWRVRAVRGLDGSPSITIHSAAKT